MHNRRSLCHTALAIALSAGAALAQDARLPQAAESLRQVYRGAQFYQENGQVRLIYGVPMTMGMNPQDAADRFLAEHGAAFGAGALQLTPELSTIVQNGRFTALGFRQFIQGIPVEYGGVQVLVLNQPVPRVVYAGGRLAAAPAGGFPEAAVTGAQAVAGVKRMPIYAALGNWTTAKPVIYQGEADWQPGVRAWKFQAHTPIGADHRAFTFFVDMSTGALLAARSDLCHADVTGNVKAMATPGLQPDIATNPPVALPVPDVRVTVAAGGNAYSDANGDFTIAHAGTAPVTISSNASEGRWIDVNPSSGAEISFTPAAFPATPGSAASPVFNQAPGAANSPTTAQANVLIHAELIHNYYKDRAPGFTQIDEQLPGNTGVAGSCNAFFTTQPVPSINFYNVGGGCVNSAYSTVIAHEYGHFVVNRRLLNQGAFGEGFSDTGAVLLYDTGIIADLFYNTGAPIRNLITTTRSYPCSGGSHDCGEVLGAFWYDALENFKVRYGSQVGLENARDLQVAWTMMTTGGSGQNALHPASVIEILTVDDNDGNLLNGTPNYTDLCAAFDTRNLDCPVLTLIEFEYPNGLPAALTSGQPTTVRVDVLGVAGTPASGTGGLHYQVNGGSYQTLAMVEIAPNQYEATIPPSECLDEVNYYFSAEATGGALVRDPINAPASSYSAPSGASFTVATDLNFETDPGWTVINDPSLAAGEWERAVPIPPTVPTQHLNPPADFDGSGHCWVTGNALGNEVNGGPTVLVSSAMDLAGFDAAKLSYARWMRCAGSRVIVVQLSANDGQNWTTLEFASNAAGWQVKEWELQDYLPLTSAMRVRFSISDNPAQWNTEAAIDRFRVVGVGCSAECYADCNGDGALNLADFGCFQTKFASGDPYADCNGDGLLNLGDFGCFQTEFAVGCP